MQKLKFEVPGSPIGQGRPKFSTINGHAKAYDPEKSRNYKAYVKLLATQAMREQGFTMIEGPCCLDILAFFEVPKSKSKKFRQAALEGKERLQKSRILTTSSRLYKMLSTAWPTRMIAQ